MYNPENPWHEFLLSSKKPFLSWLKDTWNSLTSAAKAVVTVATSDTLGAGVGFLAGLAIPGVGNCTASLATCVCFSVGTGLMLGNGQIPQ